VVASPVKTNPEAGRNEGIKTESVGLAEPAAVVEAVALSPGKPDPDGTDAPVPLPPKKALASNDDEASCDASSGDIGASWAPAVITKLIKRGSKTGKLISVNLITANLISDTPIIG